MLKTTGQRNHSASLSVRWGHGLCSPRGASRLSHSWMRKCCAPNLTRDAGVLHSHAEESFLVLGSQWLNNTSNVSLQLLQCTRHCWEHRRTFHTSLTSQQHLLLPFAFLFHTRLQRKLALSPEGATRVGTFQGLNFSQHALGLFLSGSPLPHPPPPTRGGLRTSCILGDPGILTIVVGSKADLWPKLVQLASLSWEFWSTAERQQLSHMCGPLKATRESEREWRTPPPHTHRVDTRTRMF